MGSSTEATQAEKDCYDRRSGTRIFPDQGLEERQVPSWVYVATGKTYGECRGGIGETTRIQ